MNINCNIKRKEVVNINIIPFDVGRDLLTFHVAFLRYLKIRKY